MAEQENTKQNQEEPLGNFKKPRKITVSRRETLLNNLKGATVCGIIAQIFAILALLAVLSGIYLVMFRKRFGLQAKTVRWTERERQIMLDTFFCLLGIGIADMSLVILLSGTAELERYQMLFGICIDGVLLMFLSEILHRTNILAMEE